MANPTLIWYIVGVIKHPKDTMNTLYLLLF